MKKYCILLLLSVALLASSCSMKKVEAGYMGVKVDLLGSSKGVQQEAVGTGRYFLGPNEELYLFPTFQVNYVFTAASDEGSPTNEEFTFQTNEGMECSMDLGVSMHFEPSKVADMFKTYRDGVDEIRSIVVRKSIRDGLNRVAGSMPVESVYGAGKGRLIDSVTYIVKHELDKTGIIIDKLSLIGSIRIPGSVKAALDSKVQMTQEAQKAENEVAKTQAEANIATAKAQGEADAKRIIADGEAYYNKTISSSLTANIVQMKWIEAWSKGGSLVPTYIAGSGSSNFMLQMPGK